MDLTAEFRGPRIMAARISIDAKIVALGKLSRLIGTLEFSSALAAIENARGKCIVTGIGKSGHIGRKIAATMNSTGQRAAFLHPAEAAHGDMGMIGGDDVILMLSNSGETAELALICDRADHMGCGIILVTSRRESTLSQRMWKSGDIVLAVVKCAEGDPIDRAPMASTAVQLAIGDAIAAALMAGRGFTAKNFEEVHHGGYLGSVARAVA